MKRDILLFAALLLLALSITLTTYIVVFQPVQETGTQPVAPTARSTTAVVSFCINNPPQVNNTCDTTLKQNHAYSCQVGFNDDENVSFFNVWITNTSFFNISEEGWINMTPGMNDTGNHTVRIFVDDNLGCSNSLSYDDFSFEVGNANDPPYLWRPIPNKTWANGTTLVAFKLNDYFIDPDGDELDYIDTGNVDISVTIDNTSTVTLYATTCTAEYVTFTAIEHNTTESYTASSNLVRLAPRCGQGQQGGAGAEAGTGGASGASESCVSKWNCLSWSNCLKNGSRYKECYDEHGCDSAHYKHKFWESCEYIAIPACEPIWECGDWTACLPNGTQSRECMDTNECRNDTTQPNETQNCTYTATCSDGVRNQGETGIDCGGPCPRCAIREGPTVISAERNIVGFSLFIIVCIIIGSMIAYRIFRKQIRKGITRIEWAVTRKIILPTQLSNETTKALLDALAHLESKMGKMTPQEMGISLAALGRAFVSRMVKLMPESSLQEFEKSMHAYPALLRQVLTSMLAQLSVWETTMPPEREQQQAMIDELRQLILLMASSKDMTTTIPERKGKGFFTDLATAQVALRFHRTDIAKRLYKELLELYDASKTADQQAQYAWLQRLFQEIMLQLSVVRTGHIDIPTPLPEEKGSTIVMKSGEKLRVEKTKE